MLLLLSPATFHPRPDQDIPVWKEGAPACVLPQHATTPAVVYAVPASLVHDHWDIPTDASAITSLLPIICFLDCHVCAYTGMPNPSYAIPNIKPACHPAMKLPAVPVMEGTFSGKEGMPPVKPSGGGGGVLAVLFLDLVGDTALYPTIPIYVILLHSQNCSAPNITPDECHLTLGTVHAMPV